VDEVWARLDAAVAVRKLTVFARIDFAADAAAAGLALRPMRQLVFGNPQAGTPVLAAAPTAALDLPLRISVWETQDGTVLVGFLSPAFLADRHGVPDPLRANLEPVAVLAAIAAGAA
jgi:uncharacterized protein (DUF302 family)